MIVIVLFFTQKTAYEMRISDWSSDVCSSDLMPSTIRLSGVGLAACAIATIAAASAQALPLSSFKDQGVDHIFGSYAPRGDCSKEPRVTIDEKGMTFRANVREIKPTRVEFALTFKGR